MSANDHEGPEMANGPYTGMSVEDLEMNLGLTRNALGNLRRRRDRIKAELKIAREREAADGLAPIPENPGWESFGFNVQFTGEDGRTWPVLGSQYGGKISVVAGDTYWFFDCWEEMILWLRDAEQVKGVSRIWRLVAPLNAKTVAVR